nr:MAG TPA: hypothetical protein [Caudoviricetes sp.]
MAEDKAGIRRLGIRNGIGTFVRNNRKYSL